MGKIGEQNSWLKEAQRVQWYLETYLDGTQMLGSDGTTVLGERPSSKRISEAVQDRIQLLKRLSKEICPHISSSEEVYLKLVKYIGNDRDILKTYDVTELVQS